MVETWDLLRGDTSRWGDRFFYLDVIKRYGQPALDVGCSTGRLVLDYMAQGIAVDGVDLSAAMLAVCRRKAEERGLSPVLYAQAIQDLALPRRYRTIVLSSSSFQLVTDPAVARQAAQRIFDTLEPGGAVILSLMLVWQPSEPLETDWEISQEQIRPEDGATIRRWSRAKTHPAEQTQDAEDRYEVLVNGEVIYAETHTQTPEIRWYTQEQAIDLFSSVGFVNVQALSGFSFEPAKPEDTLFCILAERPA
ncbi:methyltransferase domain-containing protein [bacterium]|nr:methyltransferase domain-containing protein [bacterium]